MLKRIIYTLYPIAFLIMVLPGCSSRYETPVTKEDSTIVYQPKNPDGIRAKITFSEKISKKTGKLINEGTVFTIKNDAKVFASVNLVNRQIYSDRELMFHIDWIGSNDNSFYRKRIDLTPDDSSTTITSSISIPPEKRQPGNYIFRVYLFRELIAEKRFELKTGGNDSTTINSPDLIDSITARITLCRKINKKTGALIDPGIVFTIKNKAMVHAFVDLKNQSKSRNQNLKFYVEWIGPNDSSFYRKRIELSSENSSFTKTSSISISPEKRQPGNYVFRIYLFNKLLAEKKFVLKTADKDLTISNTKEITNNIKAKITLCRKVSKKTGKLIDAGTVFTIKDKAKVYAIVDLENRNTYQDQKLKFYVDWVGPNDSSLYKKKIELSPDDSSSTITSSISIPPEKRLPGNYVLRIYLSRELLAEQKFELKAAVKDSTISNP